MTGRAASRSVQIALMPWREWVDARGRIWLYVASVHAGARAGWRMAPGPVPQVRLDRWAAAPRRTAFAPAREGA